MQLHEFDLADFWHMPTRKFVNNQVCSRKSNALLRIKYPSSIFTRTMTGVLFDLASKCFTLQVTWHLRCRDIRLQPRSRTRLYRLDHFNHRLLFFPFPIPPNLLFI